MIYPLLRKLFGFAPKRQSSRNPARTFKVRPNLEALEDRTLMASNFMAAGATFPGIGSNPGGPALIFKIGPGGSVTTVNKGTGPYDGVEDTYVGVVNQAGSGTVVKKFVLTSTTTIFGFDGDGIQAPPFNTPSSYTIPPTAPGGYAKSGYEGPGTFFTKIDISKKTGTVNFDDGAGHGLPPGKQTFFSLEESPNDINIIGKVTGAAITAKVFFPFRPNFLRPSFSVLGWVQFTNTGPDITGNFTLSVSVPGVGVQLLGATVNGSMVSSTIGSSGGKPTVTIHGLKHGQTEAIYVRFTYPPTISLDGIRKLLSVQIP